MYMEKKDFLEVRINNESQVCMLAIPDANLPAYHPETLDPFSGLFTMQPRFCHRGGFPILENLDFIFDSNFHQFITKDGYRYFVNLNKVIGYKDIESNGYFSVLLKCDNGYEKNLFIGNEKFYGRNVQIAQFLDKLSGLFAANLL